MISRFELLVSLALICLTHEEAHVVRANIRYQSGMVRNVVDPPRGMPMPWNRILSQANSFARPWIHRVDVDTYLHHCTLRFSVQSIIRTNNGIATLS